MRMIDGDKLHEEIYDLTKFRQNPVTKDWYSPRMVRISAVLLHIDRQPDIKAIVVGKRYKKEEFAQYVLEEEVDEYGQHWVTLKITADATVRVKA